MISEIHSELKELLAGLADPPTATYQLAYLRFRGLVAHAAADNKVYQQWAEKYLLDVSDETGEVVKLHESTEELTADIEAFIKLIDRTDQGI